MTTENNKKPSDAAMRVANSIEEMLGREYSRAEKEEWARHVDDIYIETDHGSVKLTDSSAKNTTSAGDPHAGSTIQPGDVVTLASGGQRWTVSAVTPDGAHIWREIEPTYTGKRFTSEWVPLAILRKVDPEHRASDAANVGALYVYDDTVATRALNALVDFLWVRFPDEKTAMAKDGAAAVAIRLLSERMDEETLAAIQDAVHLVLCSTPQKFPDHTMRLLRRWLDAQGVK